MRTYSSLLSKILYFTLRGPSPFHIGSFVAAHPLTHAEKINLLSALSALGHSCLYSMLMLEEMVRMDFLITLFHGMWLYAYRSYQFTV